MDDQHLEDKRQPRYRSEVRCPECDKVMEHTGYNYFGHSIYHCYTCEINVIPGEDNRY